MQRIGSEYQVTDPNGNAVGAATVTVVDSATQVALTSVYEPGGSFTAPTAKANPFVTDSLGRWKISLPDGRYDFVISGSTFPTYTVESVAVFDSTVTYPSPMLGTVTSVGLTLPASTFGAAVAVTGAGVLNPAFINQTANTFLAGPTGGAPAVPTWRVQVLADLPAFGGGAGSYGTGALIPVITLNAQGIPTAVSTTTNTPAWASVTGKPTTTLTLAPTDGVACVFTQTNTVSISNTVVESTMLGTGQGSLSIPANTLKAGTTIRLVIMGYNACSVASSYRLRLYGDATSTTLLYDSLVTATYATAGTVNPFRLEFVYTIRTTGSPGTGIGQCLMQTSNSATDAGNTIPDSNAGMSATSSIDTAIINVIKATLQFGVAGVNNNMNTTNVQLFLERL